MSKFKLPPQSRQDLLGTSAGLITAGMSFPALGGYGVPAEVAKAAAAKPAKPRSRKPNILFVFSDQERYRATWPKGVSLPGHEWLQSKGVTFHNHYCPATICTSSRAVTLTGLTTVDNGMFENCDMRYVGSLSPKIPAIGHMLRKQGYYTAYKGKWHLNADFDNNEDRLLTKETETYGFADYFGPGELIGHRLHILTRRVGIEVHDVVRVHEANEQRPRPYGRRRLPRRRLHCTMSQLRSCYRVYPEWMDFALRKAVSIDPNGRHKDMSEFVANLERPSDALSAGDFTPLTERNPLLFWKVLSPVLFLIIMWLLATR